MKPVLVAIFVFALQLFTAGNADAGVLHGTVSAAGGGLPLPAATVTIGRRNCFQGYCNLSSVVSVSPAADGSFVSPPLVAGTNYFAIATLEGYATALYPQETCYDATRCGHEAALFTVPAAGDVFAIDFELPIESSIEGTVRSRHTGAILPGSLVQVSIYKPGGVSAGFRSTVTDASGNYRFGTLRNSGLAVVAFPASPNADGLVRQAYPGFDCDDRLVPCDSTFEPTLQIAVAEALDELDFSLERGAIVSGRLTDEVTGRTVRYTSVNLQRADDFSRTERMLVDSSGAYKLGPVVAAPVVLQFGDPLGDYHAEMHDDIRCAPTECELSTGQAIQLAPGDDLTIDAELTPKRLIRGRVVDRQTNAPLAGIHVAIGSNGGGVFTSYLVRDFYPLEETISASDGTYVLAAHSAGYILRTFRNDAHVDRAAPDVACTTGNLFCAEEGPGYLDIRDIPGPEASLPDLRLEPAARVAGTVAGFSGAPGTFARVFIVRPSDGKIARVAIPATDGDFLLGGLATETIYMFADRTSVVELFDNAWCGNSGSFSFANCNLGRARSISVESATTTAGIDFFSYVFSDSLE